MKKSDPREAQARREQRKEKAEKEGLVEIEVMSLKLRIDDEGKAVVGEKPKNPNEVALQKKSGGSGGYDRVKAVFQAALEAWKGREKDLEQHAFGVLRRF